jgi:hypothetical protein
VQERRGALLAQLADEPRNEKRRIAFAALVGTDTDRADLDASIEPHALSGHGDERAVNLDADILTKLVRARTEGAGVRPLRETQHLGDVARAEHDRRLDPRKRPPLPLRDHLDDRRLPHDFEARERLEPVDADQRDRAVRRNEPAQSRKCFRRLVGRRPEGRDVAREAERKRPAFGKSAIAGGERRPDGAIKGAFDRGAQHGEVLVEEFGNL